MLANLVPSAEVTGGAFYAGADIDAEFVTALRKTVLKFLTDNVSKRDWEIEYSTKEHCCHGGRVNTTEGDNRSRERKEIAC